MISQVNEKDAGVSKSFLDAIASLKFGYESKNGKIIKPLHSGQNMPFSYWPVMFSIPVLQLIVLETGNVLMGHPN